MLRFAGWFASAERARFAFLLGARIPAWPAEARAGYRWLIIPRWRKLAERATWTEIGYALLRLPVSAVAAAISILAWTLGLVMLALPAYGWALPSGGPSFGDGGRTVVLHGRPVLAAFALVGFALLLAAPQVTRGLAAADAALSARGAPAAAT